MADHQKLTIWIGPKPGPLEVLFRNAIAIAAIMAIPVLNHRYLDASWPVDLMGVLVGLMMCLAFAKRVVEFDERSFPTTEAAADWVRGWKLKVRG